LRPPPWPVPLDDAGDGDIADLKRAHFDRSLRLPPNPTVLQAGEGRERNSFADIFFAAAAEHRGVLHIFHSYEAYRATRRGLMTNKMSIPHAAIVFVGDGRKALFLRNDGDKKSPNLKTEQVFADKNPATHDQGSDRPG